MFNILVSWKFRVSFVKHSEKISILQGNFHFVLKNNFQFPLRLGYDGPERLQTFSEIPALNLSLTKENELIHLQKDRCHIKGYVATFDASLCIVNEC